MTGITLVKQKVTIVSKLIPVKKKQLELYNQKLIRITVSRT